MTMADPEENENSHVEEEDLTSHSLKSLVNHYTDTATIHGVSQVGGIKLYTFRRKVWFLLLLMMVAGLSVLMFLHFQRYSEHPTVTVVSALVTDVLPFPAVTICNLNQFHRKRIPRDYRLRKLLYSMSDYAYIREYLEVAPHDESEKLDTGEELWEFAMNASHRLEDMFKFCVYKLANISCDEMFKRTVTDLGVCYTFNANNDSLRHNASDTGPLNGLRAILNIEQDDYYYSFYSQSGVKVVLHEPDEAPIMLNRGFFVRPGTCTDIAIHREESIRLSAPYKAFGHSYCLDTRAVDFRSPLTRYQNFSYSAIACLRDCFVGRLVEHCGCRHFFEYGDDAFCSIKQLETCYLPYQEAISMEDTVHCHCPAPCSELRYATSMSFTDFASKFIIKRMFHANLVTDRDFVRENLIELRVYYDSLTVTEVRQEAEMTVMGILGTIGGHMGLFLGASLLSVSELLEVVVLLAVGWFVGRREPSKTKPNSSPSSQKITRYQQQANSSL